MLESIFVDEFVGVKFGQYDKFGLFVIDIFVEEKVMSLADVK